MGQNRKSRNKPSYLWSINFQHRCQGNSRGERITFSTNGAGTPGYSYTKNTHIQKSTHILIYKKNKPRP